MYNFIHHLIFKFNEKVWKSRNNTQRTQKAISIASIPLDHTNAYTLLVAVVLSAQSTDKKVNELTKSLFKVADNPKKMLKLGINGIYEYIKFLGLSNQKIKEHL